MEGWASFAPRCDPDPLRSEEEQAWENMAPVGMEFGSPDFERLMYESVDDLKARKVNPGKFGKSKKKPSS